MKDKILSEISRIKFSTFDLLFFKPLLWVDTEG